MKILFLKEFFWMKFDKKKVDWWKNLDFIKESNFIKEENLGVLLCMFVKWNILGFFII